MAISNEMSEELKLRTTIKTERLLLRPLTIEDADDIFHIRSFREVYQWTYVALYILSRAQGS
jgi:RimJ/RimL family protein N-acetyltransferase